VLPPKGSCEQSRFWPWPRFGGSKREQCPRAEKWGSRSTMNRQNAHDHGTFVAPEDDDRLARERCRIRRDTKAVCQFFQITFCPASCTTRTPVHYPNVPVKEVFGSSICVQDEPKSIDRDGGLADGVQRIGGA
jgi:hypothetical protein